ncbi:MAG: hypothetical protein MJ170_04395 [Alphaproteobacteria bacterium]|nr:hypothetical protein [Alphaproteobacteria bacterium]
MAEILENGSVASDKTTSNDIAVAINNAAKIPAVENLTLDEAQKYIPGIEVIKKVLEHNLEYNNSISRKDILSVLINVHEWLLKTDCKLTNKIKIGVENGALQRRNKKDKIVMDIKGDIYSSYTKAFEANGLSKSEWGLRRHLTENLVQQVVDEAKNQLSAGNISSCILPSMYKVKALSLAQNKKPVSEPEPFVLDDDYEEQLPLPQNNKFGVVYAELDSGIDISTASKYIADDAVGFFWLNLAQPQKSIDTINSLGFQITEFAIWDTKHIRGGTFTQKQHLTMVVATRGKAPKPEDFRINSVFTQLYVEQISHKPNAHIQLIGQMFPSTPVLEIHTYNKYVKKNYTLNELQSLTKGEINVTK